MVDITDALFAQRSIPRGDEAKPHVQDAFACDRATWYRRNGFESEPFTREKLAQFAIGLGYEKAVVDTLRAAGHDVKTDMEVEVYGLVGHPDALIDDETVLEVKTTELRTPKTEVSPHYAVQAAAYAIGLGVSRAVVLVKHAGSHVETTYEIDPEGYRVTIARRAAEVLERTHPGAPIPPAEPDELAPWGCRYCSWRQCDRNPQHVAAEEIAW